MESPLVKRRSVPLANPSPLKKPKTSWFNEHQTTAWIDGEVQCLEPINFIVVAEGFPIWLPALDVANIKTLCFPYTLPTLQHPTLRQIVDHHLDTLRPSIIETPTSIVGLLLISGSHNFIHSILHQYPDFPAIYCMDHHCRGRSLPSGELSYSRLKHNKVGGGTTFSLLWGVRNLDSFSVPFSHNRSIGSFIDHSVRGLSSPAEVPGTVSWTSFMAPQYLHLPVVYPSDWSGTGFGSRTLTNKELSQVLGFSSTFELPAPTLVQNLHRLIVPIDPLRSILRTYLTLHGGRPLTRPESGPKLWVPHAPPTAVYLPSLNAMLPTSWRSAATAEDKRTSAKNDDARPDIAMWDKRITLISGWENIPGRVLDWVRYRLTIKRARRLRQEVLHTLRLYHPDQYLSRLKRKSLLYLQLLERAQSRFLETARGVLPSFFAPFASPPPLRLSYEKCLETMRNIVRNTCAIYFSTESYLAWEQGSTLFWWRWPRAVRRVALLGFPAAVVDTLPTNFPPTKRIKCPNTRLKMAEKLAKQIKRGYIDIVRSADVRKEVKNLTDMFTVPKGESDVRMIFNGTSGGLTKCIWAPSFWLPMSDSMVRILNYNYEVVDIDLGEMFNNFPLCELLSLYSGVDLTPVAEELKSLIPELLKDKLQDGDCLIGKWMRLWMGLKSSPEWATRFYYLAEELIRGKDDEKDNPLGFQEVKLNLIGTKDFCPSLPNVLKWDKYKRRPAGDLRAYVDDLRCCGFSIEEAWRIARLVASRLQYLGIQDAPRKRRADGCGPWAGTIYNTQNNTISKTVSLDKWNKAKGYIQCLSEAYRITDTPTFDFKDLERYRGFLCHLGMTYSILFPYLKGFHLALCQHLPLRDEEGWKIKELEWLGQLESRVEDGKLSRAEADEMSAQLGRADIENPKMLTPGKRFKQCLGALETFFEEDKPPVTVTRSADITLLIYGFADASKSGLGATVDLGTSTTYRIGVWGSDSSDNSSNWREFRNLVLTLEEEDKKGNLKGAFIILATDNQVAERCIHKGNSSSVLLFELIVRLRKLEMKNGAKFIITHVSGKRMMLQGTDGVSRGSLNKGTALGRSLLDYCPWARSPLENNPFLEVFLKESLGNDLEILEPVDWFRRGHDWDGWHYNPDSKLYEPRIKRGKYLWNLPAAAADAAIEQLRVARLKRRDSYHFIIIPSLMTPLWLKQFYKEVDCSFLIPAIHPFWGSHQCESLYFGICLPFTKHRPWKLQRAPKLLEMEREMSGVFKDKNLDHRNLLRKFLSQCKRFYFLSGDVLWKVLYFQ